ncbi:uncharacterized protein PITG_13411 [Phytophthora infestans T30-4]|uniref:Transmembrane protein n=1 Tax=Phytophthora infestans (strain T30-4) TaxID=403677 RepID=D0NLX4_PHYIT|nr:uncharacterized protein PITG_13411 [Phytophthora infestans T30-4]EEY60671.1 conserved hypothetical protein [Phytophthora infestans T30-4]|eukprot:XP_002900044.1 conserved hypothetical protein [Phytophthora infestans T30-4]
MLPWTRQLSPWPCSVPSAISQPIRLALETLVLVLRNSLLCIAVGWLFGYCFTVGNLLSGSPPAQQSYADFSAANIAWFYGIFSLCMVVLMATKLNIFQCTMKLLRHIMPHLVLSSTIVVGRDFVMYSKVSESWHQLKLCVYIAAFWGFYIMAIADVFVRYIYRTETPRHRHFWMPSLRRFSKVYARNLPVMFFAMISIVYVHVMSQFVALQGQWELLGFASTSIALKLALQELAKALMIAARKPVSRRVMVTLVATPTILVDTQVRMLLLRQSSTNVSVVGSVLLAGFEIVVRAVKSFIVQRRTRGLPIPQDISRRWSSFCKARREAEERRLKRRVLHAAEIYSDMYAEYIAIGCSYAILFFYRDHPQFQFTTSTQQNRQLAQLGALQMGTEVIVDLLACVLEAAEGVEFKSFDQNDSFLVYFMAVLAFSNVAISAGLYMR